MSMRRSVPLFALAALLSLLVLPAWAADPVNAKGGIAIEGYDPVAYFEDGAPAEGREDITASWNGATWRFTSAEHRDLFATEPEKYAPQYGGYCAYAVSKGKTAGIDPESWAIVDGRLFLNYGPKIQERWQKDRAAHIASADANWPGVLE